MAEYRVTHKRIVLSSSHSTEGDGGSLEATANQEVYEEGDIIEDPPEAVLSAFGDRLEEVRYRDEEEDDDSDLPDLSALTVDEVEELLADGEYDDRLDELEAQEEEGDDRSGVYSALDERR